MPLGAVKFNRPVTTPVAPFCDVTVGVPATGAVFGVRAAEASAVKVVGVPADSDSPVVAAGCGDVEASVTPDCCPSLRAQPNIPSTTGESTVPVGDPPNRADSTLDAALTGAATVAAAVEAGACVECACGSDTASADAGFVTVVATAVPG